MNINSIVALLAYSGVFFQLSSCGLQVKLKKGQQRNTCKIFLIEQNLTLPGFKSPISTSIFHTIVMTLYGEAAREHCSDLAQTFASSCYLEGENTALIPGGSRIVGGACVVQVSSQLRDPEKPPSRFNMRCFREAAACLSTDLVLPNCVERPAKEYEALLKKVESR